MISYHPMWDAAGSKAPVIMFTQHELGFYTGLLSVSSTLPALNYYQISVTVFPTCHQPYGSRN